MIVNAPTPQIACTLGDFGYLPVVTGQVLARLVLEGPPDARRARQHQKWRNRLVRAESVGMTVTHRPFDPARHRDVLLQEARQRQCRGYRALPLAFLETLTTLAPDHARLFQARYRGKAIASMLFFRHGIGSSYLIGHNSDLGRRLSAHNLLLWRGSNWLADQGHRWLDLGPVETETPAGASLARFKLGSGATPHPLGATCVYTALTAPLGRLARHVMPNTAAHVVAGQTDPSCR
ncbi:MAG: GNAT family N-acetyltransferase [Rhodobacterales bacterium]|nr:MAG: GNAT family N-acetyltransferase [Rhodobacterales bacterium]